MKYVDMLKETIILYVILGATTLLNKKYTESYKVYTGVLAIVKRICLIVM